jgi:hypothetical protein
MPPKKDEAKNSQEQREEPDLLDQLRELHMNAATELLQFRHRLNQMSDQFDGTPLAGMAGSAISDKPRPERGELMYQAVRLQLDFANQLITLGGKQAEAMLDRAQRVSSALTPTEQRPPVRLAGTFDPATRKVKATLHVYNARRQPATIRVLPSASAVHAPGDELKLAAEPPTIPARHNQAVEIQIDVPDPYEGGDVVEVDVDLSGLSLGRVQIRFNAGKP